MRCKSAHDREWVRTTTISVCKDLNATLSPREAFEHSFIGFIIDEEEEFSPIAEISLVDERASRLMDKGDLRLSQQLRERALIASYTSEIYVLVELVWVLLEHGVVEAFEAHWEVLLFTRGEANSENLVLSLDDRELGEFRIGFFWEQSINLLDFFLPGLGYFEEEVLIREDEIIALTFNAV